MLTPPATGFLRLHQVLSFYPVSPATWWAGVKTGRFPKPDRLGPRMVAWRVEDIHRLCESVGEWKPECQIRRKAADDGACTITADAFAQRIRRRLAPIGKRLVAARSESERKERGDFYLADIRGNPVEINIDLKQLGRDLVVLKPHEQVAA
jgi:prophage regulatory protein